MTRSRRKIEELLWIAGLHSVARSMFALTVGRTAKQRELSMQEFYGKLISKNALVFDIGANVGKMSAVFASLGAKVVSLEPNSDCVRHIQLSYPTAQIELIQAVAGPRDGVATLNLSDQRDDISSVSEDWIAAIKKEHKEYAGLWSRKVTVPMVSLDTLIKHFGEPYFIKIDVEGFEESVLDGLSYQPPLMSFEFNTAYFDATRRCLGKKVVSDDSQFNFARGDAEKFELPNWVAKQELEKTLSSLGGGDRHGDIFVKKTNR